VAPITKMVLSSRKWRILPTSSIAEKIESIRKIYIKKSGFYKEIGI
jgi:hypothetical protein